MKACARPHHPAALLLLGALMLGHGCARDAEPEGASGADGAAGAGAGSGDAASEPPPPDPSCEQVQPGEGPPVGACVQGALCEGAFLFKCPDGYAPGKTYAWACTCPDGIWICKAPDNNGALTFPDCNGHTDPDAGSADGG
ncbi:MAG: hypothetical protein IT375_08035 [Polyangiaceae bacterium]|nr:hypothetical protein [Polyangiaceae bacterium]